MVLCCARTYLVTLSERETLSSLHTSAPATQTTLAPQQHPSLLGIGTSLKPSGCLTQLFWGQRSTSRRNVSPGLEWCCSSECVFWVIGHSLIVLGTDSGWQGATLSLHSLLPQVWGWSCWCVWEEDLRKSFRGFNTWRASTIFFWCPWKFLSIFLPWAYFSLLIWLFSEQF